MMTQDGVLRLWKLLLLFLPASSKIRNNCSFLLSFVLLIIALIDFMAV
jgi:hypothetical protein